MKNPILTKRNIRRITIFFNSERGIKYIPYGLGARYIKWFCNTEFALNLFFRKKSPIIDEFLEATPGKWDKRKTKSGFFALNYLHGWRTSSISRMKALTYNRRVKIKDLELFTKIYDKGNGIILLGSHYGLPAVSFSLFPHKGFKNFYTILGEKGNDTMKIKGLREKWKPKTFVFKRGGESESFSQLFEIKGLLEEGNIIHILGDGAHGRASHTINFLGKAHGYRSTFAELSILTGAPVIPIFITPVKGKIQVEIMAPLDQGAEELDREERVSNMVSQYSQILEQKWIDNPQFVNGGFMNMHNRLIRSQT